MQRLPDISEWYSRERAQEEEVAWVTDPKGHQTYLDFLRPHLVEAGILTVVDCGCGSGILASGLPDGIEYDGIDKNVHFLEMARRRHGKDNPKTRFRCWDVRNFEAAPGVGLYDLAMCWAFLKHFSLDEFDQILGKVLSLGRYAAFDVQMAPRDFDDGVSFHHSYITDERLHRVLSQNGFAWKGRELWNFVTPGGEPVAVWGIWATRRNEPVTVPVGVEKVAQPWDVREQTLIVSGGEVADLENYSLRWVSGGIVWAEPVLYHKGKRVTASWSIRLDVDADADRHGGNANTE